MLVKPCSEAADTIARAAFENPGDGLVSYSTLAGATRRRLGFHSLAGP